MPFKGAPSIDHLEENDSKRPHVNLLAFVLFSAHYFRGHVGRRSAESCEFLFFCLNRKPKIDKFDLLILFQEDVVWFEISVTDVLGVNVVEASHNLSENILGFAFRDSPPLLLLQVGVEAFALNVLHHQVNCLRTLHRLVESNDILMVELGVK